jgi:hypothetical protein
MKQKLTGRASQEMSHLFNWISGEIGLKKMNAEKRRVRADEATELFATTVPFPMLIGRWMLFPKRSRALHSCTYTSGMLG